MNKLLLFTLCAYLYVLTSAISYVTNGDFSIPPLTTTNPRVVSDAGIVGWSGSLITVAYASLCNKNLEPSRPFLQLSANQLISQLVFLPNVGMYTLSFTWAGSQPEPSNSKAKIFWNGLLVYDLSPTNSFANTQKVTFPGKGGFNQLLLQGITAGILITTIRVEHANLLMNGFLNYPLVSTGSQVFPFGILGWAGSKVNLGAPEINNPNLGDSQSLLGLANNVAQSYSSTVYLAVPSRGYVISFTWALSNPSQMNLSSMNVIWNGKKLAELVPTHNEAQTQRINVVGTAEVDSLTFTSNALPGATSGINIARISVKEQN